MNQILNSSSVILLLFLHFSGWAQAKSHDIIENGKVLHTFPSSVSGFEPLGNVHSLNPDDRILRGAIPHKDVEVLVKNRVTDILSLQPESHPQFQEEKSALEKAGYLGNQIHNLGFEWEKPTPFQAQCENYLKALELMRVVKEDRKRKLYFHCTVGEDRTGLVAALYRMVFDKWDFERVVTDELCKHGYAFSDLSKPDKVSKKIQKNLGREFLKMVELVEINQIHFAQLDSKVCAKQPTLDKIKLKSRMKSLECLKIRHNPSKD